MGKRVILCKKVIFAKIQFENLSVNTPISFIPYWTRTNNRSKLFYMWKQVENVEQIFFRFRDRLYWYFPFSLDFLENKALLGKTLFYF